MPYHTCPVKFAPSERRTPPTLRFETVGTVDSGLSLMKLRGAGLWKLAVGRAMARAMRDAIIVEYMLAVLSC